MANLAAILEQELEEAFEVKNQRSLHRYVLLLTDNLVKHDTYQEGLNEVKSDVKVIAETMKQGFAMTDRRFEDMNHRFDEMTENANRRFAETAENANRRFDDMNHRFDEMNENANRRFADMNHRFAETAENANRRFDDMNSRFEDMNHRFEDVSKKMSSGFAFMNIILGVLVLITVLFKFI